MAELSRPNWISREDGYATVTGDEELTADGDTAEGGSSGDPSDEEEGEGERNGSDEEESEDEEETKGKRRVGDDSSSVKSIRIFPRKNPLPPFGDTVETSKGEMGAGSYDEMSVMTSSVN
jgi:cobalamin biosynthesis protein CobT